MFAFRLNAIIGSLVVVFATVGWASFTSESLDEILAAIKKSGGTVARGMALERKISISIEARTGRGFEAAAPSPASIEPGLKALPRLANQNEIELSLRFEGSGITDATLAYIESLANLHSLDLSETDVKDSGFVHLKRLKRLRRLEFSRNSITGIGFRALQGLTELRTLTLYENKFTDEGLAAVGQLSGLCNLELQNSEVTDTGLAHLKDLNQLQSLSPTFRTSLVHYLRISGGPQFQRS